MSGVGFWELILLFLIGLIVLGPERLPRVANQLGTWLGQARRMSRVLKRQLEDELDMERDRNIRPRPAPRALPPTPSAQPEDTYSPAHAAGSPGTGVDDTVTDGEEPPGTPASEDGGDEGGEDRATAAGNSKT
jgi:sec-independent protein translocase protein TatB